VAQKLRNYLSQGGGLLIFGGDRLQLDSYNQKMTQALPAPLREKKLAPEASAEKIGKIDLTHPALENFTDAILQESLAGSRVWGYFRGDGAGKSTLISLANGDPLVAEQKVGTGRVVFIATSADRDWTDLPLKTAYLPLIQGLTNYLAGGKRGALDGGVQVGSTKEIALAPGVVGKNLRITKPNRQEIEVGIVADRDGSIARFEDNDRAGFYRIALPAGEAKDTGGAPPLYAVNPPFLESRLDEINESELQAKLRPIQVEVIPVEAVEQGGKRTDLALPLLGLLIVILLFEGWLAQRF
jgi:hypothetical protein